MARRTIWLLIAWLLAFFLITLDVLLDELIRTIDETVHWLWHVPLPLILLFSLVACWIIIMISRHHIAVRIVLLIATPVGLFLQVFIIAMIGFMRSGFSGIQ